MACTYSRQGILQHPLPLQVGALCNTMGQERSSALYVGAVKTNVSHLEGAAGIAGLLKAPGRLINPGRSWLHHFWCENLLANANLCQHRHGSIPHQRIWINDGKCICYEGLLCILFFFGKIVGQPLLCPTPIVRVRASCVGIKAVSAMQHRQVPPNLHLSKLNPHIDVEDAWRSKTLGDRAAAETDFARWEIHGIKE